MRFIFLLPLLVFVFFDVDAQPPAGEGLPGDSYGDVSGMSHSSYIKDLLQIEEGEVLEGTFKGKVEEVCQKKGCWVRIVLADGPSATIKMKDYGFFVPLAIVDKNILVDGRAELKITSVEELRHLAEDGGKSRDEIEAITEPQETITIIAIGIKVAG